MANNLLVINAGSSSIKFAVYTIGADKQLLEDCQGQIQGIGNQPAFTVQNANGEKLVDSVLTDADNTSHNECLAIIIDWLSKYLGEGKLLAVGHRVVHGGISYVTPVLVDAKVLQDLEKLIPLAPLHQPHNLAAIRAFHELMPEIPQIACFDTAFHQTQPEIAQYTGLPRRYFEAGIRRYGFHGLSFEYTATVLPTLQPDLAEAKVIVAHLGNGASLCAMQNGRSIATTMGFSPLDGLLMGTRCGSLDPGVILYLMGHDRMEANQLEHLLYHESGLLGISCLSSDMRALQASSDAHARLAIELFVYRISREIGSLTAALGGLDALVFTGGIGENSPEIRAMVCQQASWLRIDLDPDANLTSAQQISRHDSKVSAWIVAANENRMVAQSTHQLLNQNG